MESNVELYSRALGKVKPCHEIVQGTFRLLLQTLDGFISASSLLKRCVNVEPILLASALRLLSNLFGPEGCVPNRPVGDHPSVHKRLQKCPQTAKIFIFNDLLLWRRRLYTRSKFLSRATQAPLFFHLSHFVYSWVNFSGQIFIVQALFTLHNDRIQNSSVNERDRIAFTLTRHSQKNFRRCNANNFN